MSKSHINRLCAVFALTIALFSQRVAQAESAKSTLTQFQVFAAGFGVSTFPPADLISGGASWTPHLKLSDGFSLKAEIGALVGRSTLNVVYPLAIGMIFGQLKLGSSWAVELGAGTRWFTTSGVFQPVVGTGVAFFPSQPWFSLVDRVGLAADNVIALTANYSIRLYAGIKF